MFASLKKPADDELYASWINDMFELDRVTETSDKRNYLKLMTDSPEHIMHFENRRYFPAAEDLCRAERRSKVFPSIQDIIKKHTDIYALLPLMNRAEQIKRTDYCLHGLNNRPGMRIRYLYNQKLKICPQCLKEDMEKYGRKVIHVPHQLYAGACWKHGCMLVDDAEDPSLKEEPASQQEIEMALFAHDLYTDPVMAHFQMTEDTIDRELEKRDISRQEAFDLSAEAGYTEKDASDTFFTGDVSVQISDEFYNFYIGLLTWLFKTADNFHTSLDPWNPAEDYSREDFELLDADGILCRFRCRNCGHEFYMHPDAAQYGMPCPECIKGMDDIQIYQRYADCLDDGKYSITEKNGKIHIIHEECGLDRTTKFFSIVGRHSPCPICSEKHERESRIGEHIGNATIIEYNRADDVTVQMDDGTIVKHRNYFYIKQGIETYTREHMAKQNSKAQTRSDRVGERNKNYQGVWMTITGYRSVRDIDIRFNNGDELEHRKYEDFRKGRIRCPSFIKEQRIGETNVNGHGMKITIIDYRNAKDIDVQFDTGEVVEHTSYKSFKSGYISCPKKR